MNDETTETESEGIDTSKVSRRAMITSAAGLGLVALSSSSASAQSGDVGTSANPYLKAYIDRKVYVGRTSDPSSPSDGTEWYRSDL